MIHVHPAPEPLDFEAKVRAPGLSAMQEQIGNPPTYPRTGPRMEKIADRIEDIPAAALKPYWRACLGQLRSAYGGICSYLCFYVEEVTGSATVDHFVAKSVDRRLAYEWSNYRFACALMNSYKNAATSCLDPFEVEDDWFELELVGYQLRPAEHLAQEIVTRVRETIRILDLNHPDICDKRASHAMDYETGEISLRHLEKRSPLVARELRRQGKLLPHDELPTQPV